jgi:DNA-binding NarL/FixJ family response regulator
LKKLRIVLVDDHETVRTGLRVILNAQRDMEVAGEAADGRAAVEQVENLRPDLVVMDVSIPHLNGLTTTQLLTARFPAVHVLILTRHADQGYVQQLLKAGARGYVLKQSRAAEVLAAIRAVARGGTYLDPAVAEKALSAQLGRRTRTGAESVAPGLSSREGEVLRLVAWGYSNKEIAAKLDLSVKTVETHKANAMQKLGMRNRIDIVRYALLQGWLEDV